MNILSIILDLNYRADYKFKYYLSDNFILLFFSILIIFICFSRRILDGKKFLRIITIISVVLLLLLSINNALEWSVTDIKHYYPLRAFYTAVKYTLPSIIVFLFLISFIPTEQRLKKSIFLAIPLIFVIILISTSQKTHLIYYFDKENDFCDGKLNFLKYSAFVYVVLLDVFIFLKHKENKIENLIITVILFTGMLTTVLETFEILYETLNTVLMSGILAYTIYTYFITTTKDSLTGLLNRQSFYIDLKNNKIQAIISMDMNGLKELNDTKGHAKGDLALKTISEIFLHYAGKKMRVYRVGGDEFNILVFDASEDEIKNMILIMEEEIVKAGYSVSFGYKMNDNKVDIEKLLVMADKNMYKAKNNYYKNKEV